MATALPFTKKQWRMRVRKLGLAMVGFIRQHWFVTCGSTWACHTHLTLFLHSCGWTASRSCRPSRWLLASKGLALNSYHSSQVVKEREREKKITWLSLVSWLVTCILSTVTRYQFNPKRFPRVCTALQIPSMMKMRSCWLWRSNLAILLCWLADQSMSTAFW